VVELMGRSASTYLIIMWLSRSPIIVTMHNVIYCHVCMFAHSEPSRPVLLVCTTFSDSNAKPCHEYECSIEFKRRHVFECRVLAGDSCVLDAHTRMGVCVPTPHS